jgi:hypothetical protein
MKQLSADKLFQDVLVEALITGDEDPSRQSVLATIPVESRRDLSGALLELLRAEVPHEAIDFLEADGTPLDDAQLDSAILKLRKAGVAQKVVFLRVKDAIAEATIDAVALGAAAVAMEKMAIGIGLLKVLKVLWDKLVVLNREKDGAAIDTYEAIASAISYGRVKNKDNPTTAEVQARLQGMSIDVLKGALKRLSDLQLIESVAWGGAPGDLAHEQNAWGIRA